MALLVAAAAALATGHATAGTYTWTNVGGGAWSVAGNWNAAPVFDNTAILDFSTLNITTNATLNMDGSYVANTLKFADATTASNNWVLDNSGNAGNILTLDGSTPTILVTNQTATISAGIAGAAGLTKTGAGTLELSGANSYTGVTTVSAGRLTFNTAGAIYGGDPLQWTPANIVVNSTATLAAKLGGANDVTDEQLNTLLTNLSTTNNNGLKTGALIAIDTGNATSPVTYSHVLANSTGTGGGTIGFTKLGAGVLVLDQSNTYGGTTLISAGVLRADRGVGVPTTGNLSMSGGVLEISQALTATVGTGGGQAQVVLSAGKVSGLSAYGSNPVTATLNGAQTYSGAGATLVLNATSANQELTLAGTGSLSSTYRGYINVNSSSAAYLAKNLSTAGSNVVFGKTGLGNLVIQGGWTVTGSCHPTIYGGTLTIDNCTMSVVNTETINIGRNDATLGNTGGTFVVKPGATVTAKGLNLGVDGAVPGTARLEGGTTTVSQVYKGASSGATALYFNGGTLKAADATNAANFVNANLGNAYIQANGAIIDDGGFAGITVGKALLTDPASPGGGLTKKGGGTLVLAGASTYTGTTDIQAGALQLTGSLDGSTILNLGNGSDSGKLILGGTASARNLTVAGLTTTGDGTANAIVGGNAANSTFALNIASGTTSFAGSLGGAGANENNLALTKAGNGTLVLTGTNSYAGPTTVTGGTLALDGAGTFGSSLDFDVQAGAYLDVSAVGTWTLGVGQTLKGNGTVTGNIVGGAATVSPGASTGGLAISGNADLTGSTVAIELDDTQSPACDVLTVGNALNITNATLELSIPGTLAAPAYVIATYGVGNLTGTFANLTGSPIPDGYEIDYAYNSGTAIAIKQSGSVATPPVWAATWPKVDTATTNGFTVHARTDQAGTAYYVVLAHGASQPNVSQIKAGKDGTGAAGLKNGSFALTANTENSAAVAGLSAGTTFDVWFVAENASFNPSATAEVNATTLANYSSWALANAGGQGPGGDYDNDGILNLVEYALNLNPAGSDGAAGVLTGNTLTFIKRADAVTNGDVSYAIETSHSLDAGSWTTVPVDDPYFSESPSSISYIMPSGQANLFVRLKVTQH